MRLGPCDQIWTIARASLLCVTALCLTWTAHADELVEFSIPPQPLETALLAFADQADTQVATASADISTLATKGVSGRMTPRSALERLIEGSNLRISSAGTRGFSLLAGPDPGVPLTSESPKDENSRATGEPTARDSTVQLETVIVTAQKREERLLNVPMSVSVVSTETLSKQGITQFRDYADRIPGLSYTTHGAGYTQVSLRGVTVGQDMSPTVAIYIDDVPYGSSTAYAGGVFTTLDVGLSSVERIEVLKGPQGTLYGASTIGGLIKYVTRA